MTAPPGLPPIARLDVIVVLVQASVPEDHKAPPSPGAPGGLLLVFSSGLPPIVALSNKAQPCIVRPPVEQTAPPLPTPGTNAPDPPEARPPEKLESRTCRFPAVKICPPLPEPPPVKA